MLLDTIVEVATVVLSIRHHHDINQCLVTLHQSVVGILADSLAGIVHLAADVERLLDDIHPVFAIVGVGGVVNLMIVVHVEGGIVGLLVRQVLVVGSL